MAIDMVLWDIRCKIYSKLGNTLDTDRALAPLEWYIGTGRSSATFERILKGCTSRQKATIANRLIKYNGGDYQAAINSVCEYVGYDRLN